MQRSIIGNFVKTCTIRLRAYTHRQIVFFSVFSTRSHWWWVTSQRHTIIHGNCLFHFRHSANSIEWILSGLSYRFDSIFWNVMRHTIHSAWIFRFILFFRFAGSKNQYKFQACPHITPEQRTRTKCDSNENGNTKNPFLAKVKFTFLVPIACLEYQFYDGRTNGKSLFLIVVRRSAGKV